MRWLLRCGCSLSLVLACSSSTPDASPRDLDDTDDPPSEQPDGGQLTPEQDAAAEDAAPELTAYARAVDAFFTSAADKDQFAGSVIALDGGNVVLEKGYGPADRADGRANGPDTLFRIGSVSKQFTASAILALVADGKLQVTDPISKFFPEYPAENLAKDGTAVTLHHLLSHTSGLPDGASTDYFKDHAWFSVMDPNEVKNAAMLLPMAGVPGASYVYSNYNYLLLGLVVEKVSGKSYEAFLHERFFAPLEMNDTGTLLPADKLPRAAVGYYKQGKSFKTLNDEEDFVDRDVTLAFGAGQIYSTVRDLARWDRALASGQALPAAQQSLLFTPNLDDYGYGWVMQKYQGTPLQWHNGALSPLGFSAFVARVPSKDRFVAYLSNLDIDIVQDLEPGMFKLATE